MNLRKIFYASICAHLFACALNAQMLTSGATAINILAPKWKMGVSVDASGEYSAPADLSTKIDGDLAVYSASANVKFQGAYADKHFLTLSLNYTYSQYDFSSAASPFSSATCSRRDFLPRREYFSIARDKSCIPQPVWRNSGSR